MMAGGAGEREDEWALQVMTGVYTWGSGCKGVPFTF